MSWFHRHRFSDRAGVQREGDRSVCDGCDAVWEFVVPSPYGGGGDWERLEPLEAARLRKVRAERIQGAYRDEIGEGENGE